MSVRLVLIIAFCLSMSLSVLAQGFGGLGTTSEGFSQPQKGVPFVFPRDHGSHPNYRIEWWYLTANLKDEAGNHYGAQWTLFRSALAPITDAGKSGAWESSQLWMAHAAVTSKDKHFSSERLARGGTGQAGVKASPFSAWIDDWEMTEKNNASFSSFRLKAAGKDFSYDFDLQANGPLVFHGQSGYSVKSPKGQASYYFSQPFFKVGGQINIAGKVLKVTGSAWLDREWSSQPLASDQKGWDWVSLSFSSGAKLMGFSVRQENGKSFTSATWIEADGTTTPYRDGALTMTPLSTNLVEGRKVPTLWNVKLPDKKLDITIKALNPNSWMKTSIPYWEGPVQIKGSHSGVGYLEMTGY